MFLLLAFSLIWRFGLVHCQPEKALYFVNLNDDDELHVMSMSLDKYEFQDICNLGTKYTNPFKKFRDNVNLRSGGGCIDTGYYDQYITFLHDDVDNYQSGDVVKCHIDTKKVEVIGHFDFSCEHLFGGNGANFSWCASIFNESGGASFYELNGQSASLKGQIPFRGRRNQGNTCFYDRTFMQYWCYLFRVGTDETMVDETTKKEKLLTDTDLGGMVVRTSVDYLANVTQIYTYGRANCNDMFAIIEYERGGDLFKALVKMIFDQSTQNVFRWEEVGLQDKVNQMTDFAANVVVSCEYSERIYFKAFNQKKEPVLMMVDYNSGDDDVISTKELGDISYLSQLACL